MKKCKICGMEMKAEQEGDVCPTCKTKTIKEDELRAKIKADIEAENKIKADAEAKVKAEAEEKAKADRAKLEAEVKAEVKAKMERDKIETEVREQVKKEQEAGNDTGDSLNSRPGVISGKYRATKDEQMIFDAYKTKNLPSMGVEIDFDLDLYEAHDRILFAKKKQGANGKKADLDGASSYGAEFVPEEWVQGFYMRMADMDGNLMNYFPKYPMATNIKNIAEIQGDVTISAYSGYANQNTAIENVTATSPTTGERVLTARTFVAKTNVYDMLLEDEKFDLMRGLKFKSSMKLGSKFSSALLNGDDSGTHMDEDFAAASANIPEKMFKGVRKLVMASGLTVDGTATYTLAELKSVRAKMKKYAVGTNKKDCLWIMGIGTSSQLDALLEASASTPQAADFVVKEGQIVRYLGYPIILSEHQREDLEIDGYFDESGTGTTEGFAALINPKQFVIGLRKKITLKVVPDPLNGRRVIQVMMRADFKPFEDLSSTITSAAGLYGYTVA